MALTIPIESIDLTELRRRAGDRRRTVLAREGFSALPPPPLPLEPSPAPSPSPLGPSPIPVATPTREGGPTPGSAADIAGFRGFSPSNPIPPISLGQAAGNLLAPVAEAGLSAADKLLGVLQPSVPTPGGSVRSGGSATEALTAPFDVLAETGAETAAQVPKLVGRDGELEAPTLFSSGFNLLEGFQKARDEFRNRPVGEQIGLGLAFDPTAAIPFIGPGRRLATAGRVLSRGTEAARGGLQVQRVQAGVLGLPVPPPPQSVVSGLPEKMRRLEELQEFGLKLDASANEFAAPIRSMDERIGEVVTSDNPVVRVVLGDSGINPAIKRNTTVGRATTAYQMGRVEADELVSVSLASAFDFHFSQSLRGRLGQTSQILPIDRKTGFFGNTGKLWQDVFSKPNDFDLTPDQRAMIDDYNQVSNFEVPRILDDAGITQSMRSRPEGEFYVFRDVQEIRGIETRRHSDATLQRHYDEATEGFEQGIRYDVDPRRSLEFQLRWTYNKVLRKQLDDVLEPVSITRMELVPKEIRDARVGVLREIHELEKSERSIRSGIRTTGAQGRVAEVRTGERVSRLNQLRVEVDQLDGILTDLPELGGVATEAVRVELQSARRGVRSAEVLLRTIDTELSRAGQHLARVSGKQQGTVEELRRLDRQFARLARLQDDLVSQPIDQLLAGKAKVVSTEVGRAEGAVVRAQRRFTNLNSARSQIQRQVDQLKDDVSVGRQLSRESKERLRGATTEAIVREGQRGRIKGTKTQIGRLQRRGTAQLATRVRRVATAQGMEFDIRVRRSILASHLGNVEQQIIQAKVRRTTIRSEFDKAFARTERANIAPGALFGPNQPNEIGIATWRNRFFSRADADLLKSQFESQGVETLSNRAVKGLEVLGNSIRFLSAVGDFAMPFIQGLPVLATDPNAWSRMTLRHYQAFFDPTVQARLIRDNIADFQWLARHGVPIGDPEFFRALETGQGFSPGRLLEFLPKGEEVRRLARLGGKQTFGRFGASYNTGLGWSRALLYQSLKNAWKGTDAELARYIRNLTGGLDSRALGVGPGQRAVEGMLLAFSPRLLRSTIALTVDAFKPGTVVGRRSLRSLAGLATGATSLYVLTGLALGKDWDEIKIGLNPLNGKRFLSHQINGDWIGVGGQVRAISQMIAGAMIDPQSLTSLDRFENPLLRFAGGRGAPVLSVLEATGEAFLDKDFAAFDEIDGPLDLAKHIGKSALPFAAQGIMEGEGLEATVAGLVGARTSPETAFEKRDAARDRSRDQLVASGDVPTTEVDFRELDLDIQRQIDQDSEVQATKEKVAELQTKRSRPIQLLTNELDEIDKKQDGLIAEAAEQLGISKAFREQLAVLQRDRARDKGNKRNEDVHKEAIQLIEEFEPSEAEFQVALSAYMEALNDPRLANEATGEYDFKLREEGLDKVLADHGASIFERVETFIRRNEHPLAVELRDDRETLRPYFDIRDFIVRDILDDSLAEKYQEWLNAGPSERAAIQRVNPAIGRIESRLVSGLQDLMRIKNPDIDRLVRKWEYSTTLPKNPANLLELIGAG